MAASANCFLTKQHHAPFDPRRQHPFCVSSPWRDVRPCGVGGGQRGGLPTPAPASAPSTAGLILFGSPPGRAPSKGEEETGRFFLGLRMEASNLLLPIHRGLRLECSTLKLHPQVWDTTQPSLHLQTLEKGPTLWASNIRFLYIGAEKRRARFSSFSKNKTTKTSLK